MANRLWDSLPPLMVGDVVFVKNRVTGWRSVRRWLVSWAIRLMSTSKNEDETFANHVATVGSPLYVKNPAGNYWDYQLGEALGSEGFVFTRLRARYENGHTDIEIWRLECLTKTERKLILRGMRHLEGKEYGKLKIAAHAADYALTKLWNACGGPGNVYAFRWLCRMENYPICSWAVCYLYGPKWANWPFVTPCPLAQPDDLHDEARRYGRWRMVYGFYNGKA